MGFLESARGDHDPLYAGYVLMLVLGLRRGELLRLAWEDVDLERHEASIRWQVHRIKGELLRRPTKTKTSEAPLPLPDICVQALELHSTRRTCASLLVALDVHPRVAMAILRHSQIAVTMDIYSQVSSTSTRDALKKLGEAFG